MRYLLNNRITRLSGTFAGGSVLPVEVDLEVLRREARKCVLVLRLRPRPRPLSAVGCLCTRLPSDCLARVLVSSEERRRVRSSRSSRRRSRSRSRSRARTPLAVLLLAFWYAPSPESTTHRATHASAKSSIFIVRLCHRYLKVTVVHFPRRLKGFACTCRGLYFYEY